MSKCTWLMVCLVVTPLLAQEAADPDAAKTQAAKELIQQLFGDKISKARASSSKKDDVELAGELLASAKESTEEPALLSQLCHLAYDWGIRSREGYPTAIAAMQMLAKAIPAESDQAQSNILSLYQKQYTFARGKDKLESGGQYIDALIRLAQKQSENDALADALITYKRARSVARTIRSESLGSIEQSIDDAMARQKSQHDLNRLKALLKQDPKNKTVAKQLIDMLIIQMDDPQEARKYSFLLADDETKQMIGFASTKAEDRTADQAQALGKWYQKLAEDIRKTEKLPLLEKSLVYHQEFLKKDDTKGLRRKASELMVAKLEEDIDKLQFGDARDVSKGLIARWSFNDPKRPGYDSRRRFHGKPSGEGAKWRRDPVRGGVMSFDGSGAHLVLPANPHAGLSGGTWTFWFNVNADPGSGYGGQFYIQEASVWIAISGGGVGIDLNNGSSWFDTSGGNALGAIAGKGKIKPNAWHHIAFTWDGKIVRGYHNGVRSFAVPTVGPKVNAQVSKLGPGLGNRRAMGYRVGNGTGALAGMIDEFRLYSRPLSDKEVISVARATHSSRSK